MIEDEALTRKAFYKFGRYRKVFSVDQDVVSKIEFFQDGNAAQEIRPQQETIVRFTLHDVTYADQFRTLSQDLQLQSNVWRLQVDPADYPENRGRVLRQFEEPVSFFQCLARLNRNRSVEIAVL